MGGCWVNGTLIHFHVGMSTGSAFCETMKTRKPYENTQKFHFGEKMELVRQQLLLLRTYIWFCFQGSLLARHEALQQKGDKGEKREKAEKKISIKIGKNLLARISVMRISMCLCVISEFVCN